MLTTMTSPDSFIAPTDVSQAMFDDIRERLWIHTGSLFTIGAPPTYSGTCTFVSLSGAPYLLTAAHAWTALKGEGFALSVEKGVQLRPIHRQVVEPVVLFSPRGSEEQGPDLALIRLPETDAAWIRVRKAFYNLDRRGPANGEEPAPYALGLWVVIGGIGEQSSFSAREAFLGMRVFAFVALDVSERDGFDYVDLRFDRQKHPNLPRFFGGISGSGLWQVKLLKSRSSGAISVGSTHLEGVAFCQVRLSEHTGFIRCHGRKSLYSQTIRRARGETG